MNKQPALKLAALAALLSIAAVLLAGCQAVGQEDYDAVKQQLAAKEQEVNTAKAQLAALQQQQIKPAAVQVPKRLEAQITVEMGETPSDMYFSTAEGVKGGPFKIAAGKTVGLHLVNKSTDKTHEILIGRQVQLVEGKPDGYGDNLFEKVAADVFVYPNGKKIEVGGSMFEEIEVAPGTDLWIRVVFPPEMRGEWEMGCFVQEPNAKGHYDQGMKAKLIIE